MGPLRRGLILALLPGPALASACAEVRPNWVPGTPSTAITEAIALFGTVPSLALLLMTAFALRFRSQWGGLVVVVLWAFWTSAVVLQGNQLIMRAALEGCIGSQGLFVVIVGAICAGTVLYTLPKSTRL